MFSRIFGGDDENPFTRSRSGEIELRSDRPALVISSTSWTPDEDFAILLRAIEVLDNRLRENGNINVKFVITGKGPLRGMYEQKIRELDLQQCTIQTMFLEPEDYPRLLASGDLGVCLHYSSSGVDLPMKIVDMFGSCLPVCAIRYRTHDTLQELVKHDKNGFIFDDYNALAEYMMVSISIFI